MTSILRSQLIVGAFGTLVLAYAGTAPAAGVDAAAAGIDSCPSISDDRQRLACYDREMARRKLQGRPSARAVPTEGAAAAAAPGKAAVTELTPEQRMGLTPGAIQKLQGSRSAPDLRELTVTIAGISADAAGGTVFVLSNGQVWHQVEPDARFVVRPGDTVRISRGALGSYFMSANAHSSTRVRRTR